MTQKEQIERVLQERGMKKQDLAKKLGVRPSTLSETMRRGKMNNDTLRRYAEAIGCDMADLVPREQTTTTEQIVITCPECGHQIIYQRKEEKE